jgi:3-oxoacyl-[acyl-carrier protein] reductase
MNTNSVRVALVTGGSRGIGAAVARRLSSDGMAVAVNSGASKEQAEAVSDRIAADGGASIAITADVADRASVDAMIETILDRYGRLDMVVCAAGLNMDGPFLEMTGDRWRRVIDVNLTGTFNVCQAAAPSLIASGSGSIVTVSAQTAFRGRANGANYCASKAGIVALTKCIAHELAPSVRANVIIPGLIETEEVVARHNLRDPEVLASKISSIPLGRMGTTDDVAEMVAYLASDRASYITGQAFWVNGGMMMP